ncbi:DUF1573 domain-containing protein [Myroides marinus]|jgi:hypothetical protein|uniref:DUF1573 domain-containing protein n=1 Tax=Myroides marinus TaxID=703342 RepID=A0A1H6VP63_9FLAO|nr:DUF1573 domain-containing protein [Myroides marinus]MDR0194942.1 DUF1573 domain-containing protein [Myroides sp.]KUF47203.1 hypothetical protein AS361_14355 [Myroides marinus]MDM1347712.1 DUF1573 domain-containing protein [Myroides marinus]MDM1351385.1 DUF1573 domain-containing protein [Myroides marinus]MDM1354720.1 DUF1573 domain-containing protein [Myroides marinus]
MKNILALLVLVLTSAVTFAQKGPKIQFKAENNTIDYGTVVRGKDNGVRTFEFTNVGDEPLIITAVRSTCGCTVPSKPEEPILPGQKSKIDVQYNMAPGKISRTITVESNAVNYTNGVVALRIKGEVVNN